MSIQTFKRYEKKFLLNTVQYNQLFKRLKEFMSLDGYCKDGTYKICNIYFDSPDNEVIRRSVSKPYYKEKLRLRSYGPPESDDEKVFLELKKKIGGIVNKRRAVMTYGEAKAYLQHGEKPALEDYTDRQVLEEIDWFIKNNPVVPAAFISYDRIAMFSDEDKSFRLTLDSNIQARRYDLSLGAGCYGRQLLARGETLMEVKISGAIPIDFAKLLSELKIYSHSFSKIGTEYTTMLLGEHKEKAVI